MQSFNPPDVLLLGPGPSPVPPRVLEAMARPTIGHLDPRFIAMMDQVKALLQWALQTRNAVTLPVSGPGSAGMEAVFTNLVEPGDTVIVCRNGVFGERMRQNVERLGGRAVPVDDEYGQPVDPDKVEAALKAHPGSKALAFVHAETSTGACSDAQLLCALARKHGALAIVDAVTSLGGIAVDTDAWGADAVYSGSQKCLSAPPGLSPLSLGKRALAAMRARKTPVRSWFLDLALVLDYWQEGDGGGRSYHHTAPVNMLYALHEALLMLREGGLEAAFARHLDSHQRLRAAWRCWTWNCAAIPAGACRSSTPSPFPRASTRLPCATNCCTGTTSRSVPAWAPGRPDLAHRADGPWQRSEMSTVSWPP